MSTHTLTPTEGLTSAIGLLFAGMEEVRGQLDKALQGMTTEDIGKRAVPGAHSIGAIMLHIAEAEWWWMQCVVSGHKLTPEDRQAPYWDVLKHPDAFAAKGFSAEFCVEQASKIREQSRGILAGFSDEDLERIFVFERRGVVHEHTLRWILHHLIDHEAQHKGQILMLRRLLAENRES